MTTSLNTQTVAEKKNWIKAVLLNAPCVVTFTKKDGTSRVMKCTLQEGIAIPYEKKTDRTRDGVEEILPVWDLEADAWRSINVATMTSFEFSLNGNVLDAIIEAE